MGTTIGFIKGDTMSLDYSSFRVQGFGFWVWEVGLLRLRV